MANCLITKLKANVIDDALYKVNTMTLRIQESGIGAYRMITIYSISNARMVKGNLYSDENGTNVVVSEGSEFQNSGTAYVGINEETIIEISDYHKLANLFIQSPSATINGKPINVEELGFSPYAYGYQFRFVSNCSGSIEKLAERLFAVRDFAGASQNTCVVDTRNNAVTFNGQQGGKILTIKLIEGSLTILDGSTTIATYNAATKTWTYAS